jgi:hypothetical protein
MNALEGSDLARSSIHPLLNGRCVSANAYLGLLAFWVVSSWTHLTVAQVESSPQELGQTHPPNVDSPVVELRVIGAKALLPELKSRLHSNQLGNADLSWSFAESFEPQQILTTLPTGRVNILCFIDFTRTTEIRLYFAAPRQNRFLLRELALKNPIGTIELESIAQIVELSVDALLTDVEAGISRSEVEAALTQKATRAQPRQPERLTAPVAGRDPKYDLGISAYYAFSQYSKELAVEHGPGIGVFLESVYPTLRHRFGFSGSFTIPQRLLGKSAGVELNRIDAIALYSVSFALGHRRRYFLGPSVQGGFSSVGAKPIAGDLPGNYRLEPKRHDVEGHFGVGVIGAADWFRFWATELTIGISVFPKPIRHEFLVENSRETLSTAKTLRFYTTLSMVFR